MGCSGELPCRRIQQSEGEVSRWQAQHPPYWPSGPGYCIRNLTRQPQAKWEKCKAELVYAIEQLEIQLADINHQLTKTPGHLKWDELPAKDKFERLAHNRKQLSGHRKNDHLESRVSDGRRLCTRRWPGLTIAVTCCEVCFAWTPTCCLMSERQVFCV